MSCVKNSLAAIFFLFLVADFTSCGETRPEPLKFGHDGCAYCKMTIIDPKFGAELITRKGKIFKFDAVECMINFEKNKYVKPEEIGRYYVIDASGKGLIAAEEAIFMHSEKLPSPMGANISAFSVSAENEALIKSYNGKKMNWQQVLSTFNKP
jgi:copper chaperone NosL